MQRCGDFQDKIGGHLGILNAGLSMVSLFRLRLACSVLVCLLASPREFAQSPSLAFLNDVLAGAESASAKSSERLAGGRILLADDPASYAVYEALEAQVRALRAEIGNQSDMLSFYRFQDAILGELTDAVQRIRELLVQRSDGILDRDSRDAVDGEIGELYDQVFETLRDAEFNKVKVFASMAGLGAGFFEGPKRYDLASVDTMLDSLISERSVIGGEVEALEFTIAGSESESLNAESALSQGDTDFTKELTALERSDILVFADLLMLRRETR